jgi:hypothetical protein
VNGQPHAERQIPLRAFDPCAGREHDPDEWGICQRCGEFAPNGQPHAQTGRIITSGEGQPCDAVQALINRLNGDASHVCVVRSMWPNWMARGRGVDLAQNDEIRGDLAAFYAGCKPRIAVMAA